MSEADTSATEAAAVAAEPAAAPDPALAPAKPAAETSVLDTELEEGVKQFPADYVRKVRSEAAEQRVARRQAEEQLNQLRQRYQPFEDYDADDLEVWRNLATGWKQDPRQAAEQMRYIAARVLGDPNATDEQKQEAAEQITALDDAEQAGEQPDVEKMIADKLREHDQQQKLHAEVQRIEKELTDGGFEKGTMPYSAVLWFANNDPSTKGQIGAALERFAEWKQSVIDEHIESVRAGATTPRNTASTAPAGDTAVETPEPPGDMREASRRARRWLAENRPA